MGASGGWQGSLVSNYSPAGNPSPLSKGYIDYITDSGHTGNDPAGAAFDVSWVSKPDALSNFADRSYERVTVAVRELARQHYGRTVERTYFEGCSGGGRVALVMAQKYPQLFDGIIAGAPGPNYVGAFLRWQRPARALAVPDALPSQGKLDTLASSVLAQCDRLDGLQDTTWHTAMSWWGSYSAMICW